MTRSAREVVEQYNLVVWNERDFALAEELIGDSVIRHDVGEVTTLTHEEAVARIVDHWEMFETIRFDLNLVVAGDDGEHVAIVYQSPMTLKDGTETHRRKHGDLPGRRRQDHRSVELRLQARSLGDERPCTWTSSATTFWPAPEVRARPTLMDEARRGEELGFGTGFISERWNVKEASSLTGAALAVTSRMQIATAATNHNTRHPLITGSWATTMHRLSGGRFTLGIGRGIAAMYNAFGVPAVTTAQMEDFAQVMRKLWHGEVVFNHDGPIGKYQVLFLDPDFNEDIRLAIVAFGPQTLALGGREFDDVILHTYFTPGDAAACRQDRQGRRRAGRPRPRRRAGVVVLRHRRRPPARGAAAEEDGGAAGHLPAGLRRAAGQHERLGSLGAATVPGRQGGAVDPRRHRPQGHRRADRAHRHAASPTSGWSRRPPGRRSSAWTGCARSSTTARTR